MKAVFFGSLSVWEISSNAIKITKQAIEVFSMPFKHHYFNDLIIRCFSFNLCYWVLNGEFKLLNSAQTGIN